MGSSLHQRAFRRVALVVTALVVLVAVGAAGYRWLEGMNTVDAVYMAVITLSTVGFGEVDPLSPAGRVFTVLLILGGGGLAAFTLSGVVEYVVSGAWRADWETRRRAQLMEHLTDHIIVCGYGRVGRAVVHGLQAEGLPYIVLDADSEKVAQLQASGTLALGGNAASEADLQSAGIMRARGLVAAVNADAENVFIVLTARGLRPDLLIVARANFEASEAKLQRAGANRVLLPYAITGRRMVTLLVRPAVAAFLDEVAHTSGLELVIEQVPVQDGSTLIGRTLAQAQLPDRLGITILAYQPLNGRLRTMPAPEEVVAAGAHLVVFGTREQIQALLTLAQP